MIITFDPGKATGIAVYNPHTKQFTAFEIDDRHDFCLEMALKLCAYGLQDLTVVAEKFTISKRTITTKVDYSALYIIGWVEHECYERHIPFKFQTPAQIKSDHTIATDANLKAVGWWTPTKGGHANDAARHMLVYVATRAIGQPILKRITDA